MLTAVDKAAHFTGFVNALRTFHLLRSGTERFAAVFIITAEFAIALGLLLRRWRRPACGAAVLLLTTFTLISLISPPKVTCGTWFTLTLNTGQPLQIFQNLIFIGLAIMVRLDAHRPTPSEPEVSSVPSPASHSAIAPTPTTEDLSTH